MTNYYVSMKEFDELKIGKSAKLKLYMRRYDTTSVEEYGSIDLTKQGLISVESKGKTYELLYKNVKAEIITHKSPHPAVKKEWDESVKQIKDVIRQEKNRLDAYVREDLKGITNNLLVNPDYAEVVTTKIAELRKTLESLDLGTDKLKDHYENVKEDTSEPVIKEVSAGSNVS